MIQKEKEDRIDNIASEMFDFPLMAKLALGKKNWNKMTTKQSEMFTKLFVKKLKNAYRGKVSLYDGQKVVFKESIQKKKSVHIPMVLISDDKEIVILYKFYKPDKTAKNWKVYDVEIQDISIVRTYRSQFEDILQRKTIDDLLAKLEEPETD
jgi:phospholipid transport system substrate-binding protein